MKINLPSCYRSSSSRILKLYAVKNMENKKNMKSFHSPRNIFDGILHGALKLRSFSMNFISICLWAQIMWNNGGKTEKSTSDVWKFSYISI